MAALKVNPGHQNKTSNHDRELKHAHLLVFYDLNVSIPNLIGLIPEEHHHRFCLVEGYC